MCSQKSPIFPQKRPTYFPIFPRALSYRVEQRWRRWNFFKSKAVSSKVHRNTETVILGFSYFSPLHLWDFRTAETFPQKLFCPLNHMCIFVPVHGLLQYPRKFGFRPILSRWRSILWDFSTILHFGATESDLPLFLLDLRTAFFKGASFEPIKNLATLIPAKLQGFHGTLLYHCYTLLSSTHTIADSSRTLLLESFFAERWVSFSEMCVAFAEI